jgi:methyl coenzyme M reductase subunit C-like uncharacterized protein (methanogenesis marker protein 7)
VAIDLSLVSLLWLAMVFHHSPVHTLGDIGYLRAHYGAETDVAKVAKTFGYSVSSATETLDKK